MRRLILFLPAVLLWAACSRDTPPENTAALLPDVQIDPKATQVPAGKLLGTTTFGQSFRCRHNGLARVDVLVATYAATIPSGILKIHLRSDGNSRADLASTSISAETIKDNTFVTLAFPPLRDSGGKSYYILMETESLPPAYALTVWTSAADIYLEGAFYIDGHPHGGDMCFQTYYVQNP